MLGRSSGDLSNSAMHLFIVTQHKHRTPVFLIARGDDMTSPWNETQRIRDVNRADGLRDA